MERENYDSEIINQIENFYYTEYQSEEEYTAQANQTHKNIQEIKKRSLSEKINKSAIAEMRKEW